MPGATPVTKPVVAFTVAVDVLPLVHTPPGVVFDRVVLNVGQTDAVPVIAAGAGLTVATLEATQPPGITYEIVDVPELYPTAIPDVAPMPATTVLLLLHVPPNTVLLNTDTAPMHKAAFPVIGATVTTVTGMVLKQPVGSV